MTRLTAAQAQKLGITPTKKTRPKKPRTSAKWDAKILPDGVWLQIPNIPPSLNVWRGWHWGKQGRYKQGLYDAVSQLVTAFKLPKIKYARIEIVYYFSTKRSRDLVDNYSPKFIMDALVNGGILEDDRTDYIGVPELVERFDKEMPRVEIFIRSRKGVVGMKKYITYTKATKEVLDKIKVGDLIKVNGWAKPMRVKGVSENYAVMVQTQFGKVWYSVIEKKLWDGIQHNSMTRGCFHCGRDYWLFGAPEFDYNFKDAESVMRYLQTFESGESKLSERNAIPILELHIKREERA